MLLTDLLNVIGLKPHDQDAAGTVTHLTYDTRAMSDGALLVLTASQLSEAMLHHLQAHPPLGVILTMEHAAYLAQHNIPSPLYVHSSPHQALSLLSAALWPQHPETIVAVTGTNGKSSTVHFAQSLWDHAAYRAASIGTLGMHASGLPHHDDTKTMTSPNALDLRKMFASLVHHKITHVALEASSHGLQQHRLLGIPLQAAGFTQLTQDHLDYHLTLEDYFVAKTRLFTEYLAFGKTAVLNQDCPFFDRLKSLCSTRGCTILTYGHNTRSDLQCFSSSWDGQAYHVRFRFLDRTFDTRLTVLGDFQIMNIMCAVGLLLGSGTPLDAIIPALPLLRAPEGRLSYAGQAAGHGQVYIDYAHTPDSLKNVLQALRPLTSGKLRVVFGCGGDRDTTKRPIMGKIAQDFSDVAYVTDDNPRTEDPSMIRAQILMACPDGIDIISGRTEAIRRAMIDSQESDIVLIAGKGHERTQTIGARVLPFRDHDVVQDILHTLQKDT